MGDKLAIDLLAAKGKTHLKLSNFEEKNFLKKSQIGKFCDENLIKSGKNELIQSSIAAVKKGKYQSKSPFINGIVTSGLPKEFVSKTNFNPQEYDFNKREEQQNYNELAYSERNEMDNNYVENQKLIDHPSNYPAKNNKKKVAQLN